MMATHTKIPVETIFRALSDRTRLRILNLLRGGELCVCDLVDVLDLPQPTVSRHLAYLRNAQLVTARKDGVWQHYRLAPLESPFHKKLLECVAACADESAELTQDTARLRSGCRSECCD